MKRNYKISCLRTITLFALAFIVMNVGALNYTVSFSGKGASTEVTSVQVDNITKGTSVTVPTGQVLILSDGLTTVEGVVNGAEGSMKLLSDIDGNASIHFQALKSGPAIVELYSADGRRLAMIADNLNEGLHSYNLTLPGGLSVVRVSGNGFAYNSKTISRNISGRAVKIVADEVTQSDTGSPSRAMEIAGVSMNYTAGDRIIFRGNSGTMTTLVSDIITADKTIEFNFVPCTDANGNHYATITIGDQVWMAENLKATKYADGTDIILRASKAEFLADANRRTTPICRYFNDDPATKDIAGLAYKFQTINHKDLCPVGWKVPNHFEWRVLRDAISLQTVDRYNAIRKTGPYWANAGATNASGFSAVAGGTFWEEWPIHYGTWAIWLASDLWNNDPNNSWFFYAGTDDNPPYGNVVVDELASDAFAMFGAIRCLKVN